MYIDIDFNSDEAIYLQLCNQIILEIALGHLEEGYSLPSVRQMADLIGINMHTVNKAYALLRQNGFVTIDRRRGAIVCVDADRLQALREMKQDMAIVVARAICRNVTKEEVHQLVDEIYGQYDL